MHKRGNICRADVNATVEEEKVDDNNFKFKELLHCRKTSFILVCDFQSSKIVLTAENLKLLWVFFFVEREAEREERKEKEEERRENIRIYKGDLRNCLWLRRGECS